jgi:hypothetical protein
MSTVGRRLLAAYGAGDTAELIRLYHPEATLYDPACGRPRGAPRSWTPSGARTRNCPA